MTRVPRQVEVCTAALCRRDADILVVERSKPPRMGAWTLPGGHLAWGEEASAGVLRELFEETGATGGVLRFLGVHEHVDPDCHLVVLVYDVQLDAARRLCAGDDARAVAWKTRDEMYAKNATIPLIDNALAWASTNKLTDHGR